MCITCDLGYFVNRHAEIEMFSELLADTRRRALLLYGPEGIGKSCTIHHLRHIYNDKMNLLTALVDFRRNDSLSEVKEVMRELRKQIGGTFEEGLQESESKIKDKEKEDKKDKVKIPSRMYFSSQFTVRIGENKLTSPPVIIDPARARNLDQIRRNREFRKALRELLQYHSVVLFFDHFEDATREIKGWIQKNLLNLWQEHGFHRLWLVIAGRDVPQQVQDEAWRFRPAPRSQKIRPLTEDAMREFWVEKHQLDPDRLMEAVELSGGNPELLVMIAKSDASSMGKAQSSE